MTPALAVTKVPAIATRPSGSWPRSPAAYMCAPNSRLSITDEGLTRVSTPAGHPVLHHHSAAARAPAAVRVVTAHARALRSTRCSGAMTATSTEYTCSGPVTQKVTGAKSAAMIPL